MFFRAFTILLLFANARVRPAPGSAEKPLNSALASHALCCDDAVTGPG
jgi:hypothetical protein